MASSTENTRNTGEHEEDPDSLTPFSHVAKQRGRLLHNGKKTARSRAFPLVRLLWKALNEEASLHLTVDELSILGYAMCGHPVSSEMVVLQIHKMRAYLASRKICNQFIDEFSTLPRSKSKKSGESQRDALVRRREQEANVRNYVSNHLRPTIKEHLLSMFPSAALGPLRQRLLQALELFFACLPFGHVSNSMEVLLGSKSNANSNHEQQAKIASILKSQFKRSRSRTLPSSNIKGNPNRMAIEMHVVNSFFLSGPAIVTVRSMNSSLFWVTEEQFQLFTMDELIGATSYSKAIREQPECVTDFLQVVLQRVYAIQGRLNSIEQASLFDVLRRKLEDMNYNFDVDVRAAKAAEPDRLQFVVREAVKERRNPKGCKWCFLDGKWMCVEAT